MCKAARIKPGQFEDIGMERYSHTSHETFCLGMTPLLVPSLHIYVHVDIYIFACLYTKYIIYNMIIIYIYISLPLVLLYVHCELCFICHRHTSTISHFQWVLAEDFLDVLQDVALWCVPALMQALNFVGPDVSSGAWGQAISGEDWRCHQNEEWMIADHKWQQMFLAQEMGGRLLALI